MRIALLSLHTAPTAQPGQGDAGGLNVYVRAAAAELAARGHTVEIITADPAQGQAGAVSWMAPIRLGPGVRMHRLRTPARTKEELYAHLDAITAALIGLPALQTCEVIWAHYWISALAGLAVREASGTSGTGTASATSGAGKASGTSGAGEGQPGGVHSPQRPALLVSFHTIGAVKDRDTGTRREPDVRLAAEPRIAQAADLCVANTPAERADIIDLLGAAPAHVIAAPPGIDHAVFVPGEQAGARHRLGLPADVPMLLAIGRMQHIKGTDVLIAAMPALAAGSGPPAHLWLLGAASGTDAAAANRMAAAAAAEPAITLTDPVPAARLADWYRAADLLLVPSRSESFGFAAAEALACGTPVLAAAVGGLRWILSEDCGWLLDSHDPAAWAGAIAGILADRPALQRAAAAAPQRAAAFTWTGCIDAVEAALEQLGRAEVPNADEVPPGAESPHAESPPGLTNRPAGA